VNNITKDVKTLKKPLTFTLRQGIEYRQRGEIMEIGKRLYTAGRFARKAGVTMRTIHYYDKEGILQPSSHSEAGYRLYNDEDFGRLQKILTLKFLGFSLEEIKSIIRSESEESSLKTSLDIQEKIIDQKIKHLELVKKAVSEARQQAVIDNEINWDRFINIIKVINMERTLLDQYKDSMNLSARIRLHDLFSTNKYGWHLWLFDQFRIGPSSKILELGCGDGSLWARNSNRIPKDCSIYLTDLYEGMLEDAQKTLNNYNCFNFCIVDAQNIPFEDESFDIVIANHMLYHIPDRRKALSEIYRVLRPGGLFYASTIGKNHLIDLKLMLKEFNNELYLSGFEFWEEFGLETGKEQLMELFNNVSLVRYEDSLVITEVQPLIDYICSTSGNTKEKLVDEKLIQFSNFINNKLSDKKHIFITKDSGVFECIK
jgi:ubiquinone/menaquinone biosynthesis C-methylase UbiE